MEFHGVIHGVDVKEVILKTILIIIQDQKTVLLCENSV